MPRTTSGFALRFLVQLAVMAVSLLLASVFVPLSLGWQPVVITSGSMQPQLQPGDVVLIDDVPDRIYEKNDVIMFQRRGQAITHRVVDRNADGTYVTRGDASTSADQDVVSPADVVGRARMMVPMVGLAAIHPREAAALSLLFAFLLVSRSKRASREVHSDGLMALPSIRLAGGRWASTHAFGATVVLICGTATLCLATTLSQAAFASTTSTAVGFTARDGYYSAVKALSPQAYWRFGEASGSVAVDEQGLLNGSYSGVSSYATTGSLSHDSNSAVTCTTGSTCFSTADHAAFHNTGAQSIALWLKPSVASQSTNARVFAKYDGTNITYFVAYDATSGRMRYLVDTASKRVSAISTTLITNTSSWYFIAGTFDGTTARIYINGVPQGTDTGSGGVKQNNVGFAAMANVGGTAGARGSLDDVAVWDRVLTPTEIANLYTLGTT
jgi:signal peptidase I